MPDDEITEGLKDIVTGTGAIGAGLGAVAGPLAGSVAAGGIVGAGVGGAGLIAAGAGGALIGAGIDHATGGAISDGIGHGLLDLVGEQESLSAARSFDDGNILDGLSHMAHGAGETISHAFGADAPEDGSGMPDVPPEAFLA